MKPFGSHLFLLFILSLSVFGQTEIIFNGIFELAEPWDVKVCLFFPSIVDRNTISLDDLCSPCKNKEIDAKPFRAYYKRTNSLSILAGCPLVLHGNDAKFFLSEAPLCT
jgi:hypothetical protein